MKEFNTLNKLCIVRDVQGLRSLVDNKANVNSKDDNGCNLLVGIEDEKVVETLIDLKVDVNGRNSYDDTPLFYCRTLKKAKLLVNAKADVNAKNKYGQTPIFSEVNRPDVIKFLIRNGADVKAVSSDGYNALQFCGSLETAKILVNAKIDINLQDNNGDTALFNPSVNGEVAKFLIDKRADVNIRNKEGNTPLHACVSIKKAKILLDAKADINAENFEKETPLEIYRDVEPLAERNVIRKKGGFSLYDYDNERDFVKFLIEHGAEIGNNEKRVVFGDKVFFIYAIEF